jgi:hypothetical protein
MRQEFKCNILNIKVASLQHIGSFCNGGGGEEKSMEIIGLVLSIVMITWIYSIYRDMGKQVDQNEEIIQLLKEIKETLHKE